MGDTECSVFLVCCMENYSSFTQEKIVADELIVCTGFLTVSSLHSDYNRLRCLFHGQSVNLYLMFNSVNMSSEI